MSAAGAFPMRDPSFAQCFRSLVERKVPTLSLDDDMNTAIAEAYMRFRDPPYPPFQLWRFGAVGIGASGRQPACKEFTTCV